MGFKMSSLSRKYPRVQSNVANKPPHTPKAAPVRGACMRPARLKEAQRRRSLRFSPALSPFHAKPPTRPMEYAPPMSAGMRMGHGSRSMAARREGRRSGGGAPQHDAGRLLACPASASARGVGGANARLAWGHE